jgi:hypothetical protein
MAGGREMVLNRGDRGHWRPDHNRERIEFMKEVVFAIILSLSAVAAIAVPAQAGLRDYFNGPCPDRTHRCMKW